MDPLRRGGRVGDRRSFPGALPDDRLQRANVRLDFHQDGLASSIEPDIRRPTAHPRDGSLDGGMPAWVASAEDGFDDPSMRSIVDEWRASRIDRDPEVGAQHRHGACANPCRDVRAALLHPADDRAFVADGTPGPICGWRSRGPPAESRPPRPARRVPPAEARVRQMSSHRTLGGLPALLEPARTRTDDTLTHDHA